MPFGSRGGIRVNHYFSHDGEYQLRAFLEKQRLTPTEGVRFFRTTVRLKAGPHVLVVTFPNEFAEREGPVSDVSGPGGPALGGPLDLLGTAIRPTIEFRVDGRRVKLFEIAGMTSGEAAFDGQPGPPTLGRIEIAGPYNVTGVSETPSRKRIFACRPTKSGDDLSCADRILSGIVRRAFRRDITQSDLKPFLSTFQRSREKGSFDESIAAAIRDVLLAPDFLFRLEFDPPGSGPGSVHAVSDFELASRLSFFLWSTIPDDALLDVAARGQLRPTLENEIRRMLMIHVLLRWPIISLSNGSVSAALEAFNRILRCIRSSTRPYDIHSGPKPNCLSGISFGKTGAFWTCSERITPTWTRRSQDTTAYLVLPVLASAV